MSRDYAPVKCISRWESDLCLKKVTQTTIKQIPRASIFPNFFFFFNFHHFFSPHSLIFLDFSWFFPTFSDWLLFSFDFFFSDFPCFYWLRLASFSASVKCKPVSRQTMEWSYTTTKSHSFSANPQKEKPRIKQTKNLYPNNWIPNSKPHQSTTEGFDY